MISEVTRFDPDNTIECNRSRNSSACPTPGFGRPSIRTHTIYHTGRGRRQESSYRWSAAWLRTVGASSTSAARSVSTTLRATSDSRALWLRA
jgi:hypothetical protein